MADKIGFSRGKPLTKGLWILDSPYIIPGREPWGYRCLYKSVVTELLICLRCCTASHYGKTYRHMKVRISEHQGVSPRTGKRVKGTLSTSVRDHMLNCNHTVA